jgi:pSer/pThr/pTyr-binding forkhead associated (FHA) protein
MVITLNLVHPTQTSPSQSWNFGDLDVIRIGRAPDNDVVLYSAVVSRYHVELHRIGCNWKIINLGANGTYVNNSPIIQSPVIDGMILRLARSGPQIQIEKKAREFENVRKQRQGLLAS